jgi:hypothetical protein
LCGHRDTDADKHSDGHADESADEHADEYTDKYADRHTNQYSDRNTYGNTWSSLRPELRRCNGTGTSGRLDDSGNRGRVTLGDVDYDTRHCTERRIRS